jgi:hypothetical protein
MIQLTFIYSSDADLFFMLDFTSDCLKQRLLKLQGMIDHIARLAIFEFLNSFMKVKCRKSVAPLDCLVIITILLANGKPIGVHLQSQRAFHIRKRIKIAFLLLDDL